MADYQIDPNDTRTHTRYSELLRCTYNQIDRVLAERAGANRFEGDNMADGTVRHSMFQEESEKTGKLPTCFGLDWPVSHIEHEFATELLPGIVVHSRPDAACEAVETVVDYKTVLDGSKGWKANVEAYKHASKQRQLVFYAYQMGLHGIRIKRGLFLLEIWNKDRDKILGYEQVAFPITLLDMANVLSWARPRMVLLATALEMEMAEKVL